MLLALLLYTLARRILTAGMRRALPAGRGRLGWRVVGGLIGLYDGAFGPGTGSFFVFAGVRWLGYDFLHASAHAVKLNAATNLAALALVRRTAVIWGAWPCRWRRPMWRAAGSARCRAAPRHRFPARGVFVVVVGALIVQTSWDDRRARLALRPRGLRAQPQGRLMRTSSPGCASPSAGVPSSNSSVPPWLCTMSRTMARQAAAGAGGVGAALKTLLHQLCVRSVTGMPGPLYFDLQHAVLTIGAVRTVMWTSAPAKRAGVFERVVQQVAEALRGSG